MAVKVPYNDHRNGQKEAKAPNHCDSPGDDPHLLRDLIDISDNVLDPEERMAQVVLQLTPCVYAVPGIAEILRHALPLRLPCI